MRLQDIPADELVRLSQNSIVTSYMVFIDTGGSSVIWKLRFQNGRVDLFFLAPAVAVNFMKGALEAGRKFGWPLTTNWPSNPLQVTERDRDFLNSKHAMAVGIRSEFFRDAAIVALMLGEQIGQVIRLSPEYAMQIADMHRDALKKNILRDIAAESPPTDSAH